MPKQYLEKSTIYTSYEFMFYENLLGFHEQFLVNQLSVVRVFHLSYTGFATVLDSQKKKAKPEKCEKTRGIYQSTTKKTFDGKRALLLDEVMNNVQN